MTRLLRRLAAVLLLATVAACSTGSDGRAEVVDDDADRDGWKVLRYDDVEVDVPSDWVRLDTGTCPFPEERWGPPGAEACGGGGGVVFAYAPTYDSATDEGEVRAYGAGSARTWAGYVSEAEVAVAVDHPDRSTVADVLATVRCSRPC